MNNLPELALIGGLQLPELIFVLFLLVGKFAIIGGLLYWIIRAAVRAGVKSAANDCEHIQRED